MSVDRKFVSAFSMVEVVLALGLAAFCLVAVLALLPAGINSNQNAIQQTTAATLARAVVSDLRTTPLVSGGNIFATSPVFGFQIPAAGHGEGVSQYQTVYFAEGGNPTGTMGAAISMAAGTSGARFRVTVTFNPPPSPQKTATNARILVTWPAAADPSPSSQPVNFSGSYETTTALNRN